MCTPPTIASPFRLTPLARLLLAAISLNVGKAKAVKREELRQRVELWALADGTLDAGEKLTDPEFRRVKEDLTLALEPMCWGPRGYYYGANMDETEETAKHYDAIAADAVHKADCIRRAGRRLYSPVRPIMGKQLRLDTSSQGGKQT